MAIRHFQTIGVVGAGTMGAQIALHCAAHGYRVRLFSRSTETLQRAAQGHALELEQRLARRDITVDEQEGLLSRIQSTTDMQEAVAKADLVIENVPEDLEIKRAVFGQVDRLSPHHTLLATNSSSICISALEDVTQRPERMLNMHFYSPVWQRPMVELMGGTATTEETMARARHFVRTLDLTPLSVCKESMGFLFNRVWRAIKKECLHLVEPQEMGMDELPQGVLHPRRIKSGVVSGIQDYGNKMGIPTINGAIYYDAGYTANPLVYCGCVGLAPRGMHPRQVQDGDHIVVLGGKTGRDGLRGATFSSMTMDAQTGEISGASVQIGAPIVEKGLVDVLMEARDQRLY
ncbi:MAG: 3-hydroxyacyl-CoA dehydrogenase NAD-binding domain-containing protein, partial [Candidatus Desulfacyla sp.]